MTPPAASGLAADRGRTDPVRTIGERLELARRRRFVGRRREMRVFCQALAADLPPFSVLYVHGPGGVGKTTLLKRYAAAANAEGVHVASVDLRHVGPSAAGLMDAVRTALNPSDDESLAAAMQRHRRFVLILDTYEAVASADDWVREELAPALPAEVLVVLAGRKPPSLEWRVDPGWSELVRIVALDDLGEADCRDFLAAAGMPEHLHDVAIDISHGHPLALTLLADVVEQQGPTATVGLVHDRDLVKVLLERFASGIPDQQHRRALEACAFVRALTESTLRVALDVDDAGELFSWLRTTSIVEESTRGLVVHDLARDALESDFRWRDPTAFRQMRRRILSHITAQLPTTVGRHQQHLLFDIKFLHRTRVEVARHDWDAIDQVGVEPLRPQDRAAVLAMTTRHEGPESARWAAFWLDRRPEAFSGFRGPGELLGFSCYLELNGLASADRDADPATRNVWRYAELDPELSPEDSVTLVRYIMDAELYQQPSRAFDHRVTITGHNFFSNPRLAWDFISVRDPYPLARELEYFDYTHRPEADFATDEQSFTVYGRDWRRHPLAVWVRLMGQRALAEPGNQPEPEPDTGAEPSRPQFDAAVKDALRNLTRPTLLAGNVLLRTRLAGRADGTQAAARVAACVRAAAQALAADPRDRKLYHAVDRTYLRPAPSKERAAEALGLPFSTYRRHLAQGVGRVSDALWLDAYPISPTQRTR